MKIITCKDYSELSQKSAGMICEIINSKPEALLCFPAGETSIGTFEQLVRLEKEKKVSFKKSKIVGLDEWVGLGKMKSENCYSFLKKHFFSKIKFSEKNFCFFDGESDDLESECRKTDSFIKEHGPVDMILLGAGMNGHLGLNEPGTSFGLYSHIVTLDDTTKSVGQKYFSGSVRLTRGITLGIKHILESKTAILQLSGVRKAAVASRLLNEDPSESLPASAMKLHPNSFLVIDEEAAGI
jgi:glucosamine-6-phosphate isomerase